jgi:hypothetical protein
MTEKGGSISQRQRRRTATRDRRVAKAEERRTLFDLVVSGHSTDVIAREMGVSAATVRREVDKAIAERRLDAPDRYVRLQVARIEKALVAADAALERGDLKAVSPYLKVVAALDRYHGLAAALAPPAPEAPRLPAPAPPLALTHAGPPPDPDDPIASEVAGNGA